MEIWDAYNEDGSLAGIDLIRGEEIPKGLYHGVAEVFVSHIDGSILLMQRDLNKPNSPGLFESGAGGSLLKGESFLEGAIRELKEETGINCTEIDVYKRQDVYLVEELGKNKIEDNNFSLLKVVV